MQENKLPKLVRDLVVDRIHAKGEPCKSHLADAKERQSFGGLKILEEAEEFYKDPIPGELIDIQQIVMAMGALMGHAIPSNDALNEWIGALPDGDDENAVLDAAMRLIGVAEDYIVKNSNENYVALLIELERVTRITGFDRVMLESVRINKLVTEGGFEKWIILDEA